MSVQFRYCCVNLMKCTSYSKANNDCFFHVGVTVALSMNRLAVFVGSLYFQWICFMGGSRGGGGGPRGS